MALTMTGTPALGVTGLLDDILLGSKPTADSRWSQRTRRVADINTVGYDPNGDWSCACNQRRVGPGTIGWIASYNGTSSPSLGGFLVCTGTPYSVAEIDGHGKPLLDASGTPLVEWYVDGRLHGRLAVPGSAIAAAGWGDARSPWGACSVRQFRNGERIGHDDLLAMLRAAGGSLARAAALEHHDVVGQWPWWWRNRRRS